MANEEHLKILLQGVEVWNKWRKDNPDVKSPDLRHADLSPDSIKDTSLYHSFLVCAELDKGNFQGTNLSFAKLQSANFDHADLHGANLESAKLRDSRLWDVNLQGANLKNSDVQGAILSHADLRGATLRFSNLHGAHLHYADLNGADLRSANLCEADVTGVKYDRKAKYKGIRVATCYGSQLFKRFAQDQDFLEEFRSVWWRKPIYWLWLITCDCGRSLLLWAAWSLLFAIGFGMIFYGSLGESAFSLNANAPLPWNLQTTIYYSVVTFTTLGFGDLTPTTNTSAWCVAGEVILGYIMLGGLISIFANKLARRS